MASRVYNQPIVLDNGSGVRGILLLCFFFFVFFFFCLFVFFDFFVHWIGWLTFGLLQVMKAGFAGDDRPKSVFSSFVGED